MADKKSKSNKTIPDTSIIISGKVSKLIGSGALKGEIIIPEVVLSELENQANRGKAIGFEGLEELTKLKELDRKGKITLTYYGNRPNTEEIKAARFGAIDALIREVATKLNATLLTGDYVQYLTAKARGVTCKHIAVTKGGHPKVQDFFDKDTMSVHLKQGVIPLAKKGRPGNVDLVKISDKPLTEEKMKLMAREVVDYGRDHQCIEISMKGATVVQLENFRIAVAQPPFSEKIEITAVRPIAKVSLEDYNLSEKLMKRLEERAEGVFICGPPGAGKSSFAASLAEFYRKKKKAIVKTMESPRDLQVSDEITQYAPLEGSMEKTSDILLLVRPDYTVYDEVRKSNDFRIFADMRLAGVGMIGVTHSASPLDAIQRVISRIELGQIPLIIDTIIFVKDAEIKKVYETKMTVKVPSGMTEADLARPVVEVKDFETGRVEHEIYTFGEQTIIVGAKDAPKTANAQVQQTKSEYILSFENKCRGKEMSVYAGKNFLFKTTLDRSSEVRIRRKGRMGKMIQRALRYGDSIRGFFEE